jgi:hypothetical protein
MGKKAARICFGNNYYLVGKKHLAKKISTLIFLRNDHESVQDRRPTLVQSVLAASAGV